MKVVRCVPLFKIGNRKEFSNYRPVSILPLFLKIIEKLIINRLVSYQNENNIMYKCQYGFKEAQSTGLALI